jgi:hypothetical protein
VSMLRPGDEVYHYSDGSHRWIPPDPAYDQKTWNEQVRQHQQGHLTGDRPCRGYGARSADGRA